MRRGMLSAVAAARTILGTVTVVTGAAEFLSERTVHRAIAAARRESPDVEATEALAADLAPGELLGLTSPSLFSSARAVVVRGLQDLNPEVEAELLDYAAQPADDVAMVLVHNGGAKGKKFLDAIKRLDAVRDVPSTAPKPWELSRFVTGEVREAGGTIDEEAAELLVAAVGADLRALSAAAEQLVSDFAGERLTLRMVSTYYAGRAEVKGWDIADAAINGEPASALEQLRWTFANGESPVLVTSAFASGLRGLARLMGAPRGLREADLAREVGVSPYRLKLLRGQVRAWSPAGVAQAIEATAEADLAVKGAAGDAQYALERLVFAVDAARTV